MAKNGLDKWFKQKWVDIGSRAKRWFFRKVWPFKTESVDRRENIQNACPLAKATRMTKAKGECCCKRKRAVKHKV